MHQALFTVDFKGHFCGGMADSFEMAKRSMHHETKEEKKQQYSHNLKQNL